MEIRFLEIAQVELDNAIEYYNLELLGLGGQFLLEVIDALERIKQYPEAWCRFEDMTRRCQTRRFPYGVVYQILEAEILIVAISHLHRKPDYWRDRNIV